MILSTKDAKELIKRPFASAHLQRARYQEARLRFHAQVAEHWLYSSTYRVDFLAWVKNILTAKDKYAQFENMLTFPLKTNEVVDSIADEYSKIFSAQNAFVGYDFDTPEAEQEYTEYSKGYEHFWRKDVFSAMLTAVNSIIVIDLPATQEGEIPKPYYYLLGAERVIDVRCDRDGTIEYLIFHDIDKRYVVADDNFYHVFQKEEDKITKLTSNFHGLGYVPACFMWNDSLDARNPYIKQSPISAILGDLDWYLFQLTSKKCLDIYASFPIYWHFDSKCGVDKCQGGFIAKPPAVDGTIFYDRCPSCEKNSLVGAGSVLKAPPPRDNTSPNLREPAGIIPAERESLDYNVDETERLKDELIKTATGKLTEKSRTTGAINEDQVHSNYESQTNILMWIGSNFEKAHKFVIDTTARLMYGDAYMGCTVSYGTEFYLQDQDAVTAEYQSSKEAGMPMYILQAKRNQVDELQSKNNPQEKKRLYILRQLEPYQDVSIDVLMTLPTVDQIKFAIKLDFTMFVNKFEREHGDIVEWGSALDLSTKINRINTIFETWQKEQYSRTVQESTKTATI